MKLVPVGYEDLSYVVCIQGSSTKEKFRRVHDGMMAPRLTSTSCRGPWLLNPLLRWSDRFEPLFRAILAVDQCRITWLVEVAYTVVLTA